MKKQYNRGIGGFIKRVKLSDFTLFISRKIGACKMSDEDRIKMNIAQCKICLLAENMKDCKNCAFNFSLKICACV